MVPGEGNLMACNYYPEKNLEVFLPQKDEINILVSQTEFLEDVTYKDQTTEHLVSRPHGVAIDLGTTTVVLYFLDLLSGQIEKIASFLNPQQMYGADIISRITYCQEHKNGLMKMQESIIQAINDELGSFGRKNKLEADDFERIVIAGNTTMLHILLGKDPVPIALAPFTPKFTSKQIVKGISSGLNINEKAELFTLPCVSAYVGADIVAGLAALNTSYKNYLFLDIGTNGEIALRKGREYFTCSTAAGPAFEGANLSCGMGAVSGAISVFSDLSDYQVIGNMPPRGICGSGIVDIVAYMLRNDIMNDSGVIDKDFIIHRRNKVIVSQQDIREIQLAKSAIYSGIRILLNIAELSYNDIDALFLAGGFGNYINIHSSIQIGLLPFELKDKIYPIGNSAGIGALQYLKSDVIEKKVNRILKNAHYIELSNRDDFTMEFALNMNFEKQII
jgi:uncharacterized 2Fe-2S/4Fe-4S cluster protein (DUF4445 family)